MPALRAPCGAHAADCVRFPCKSVSAVVATSTAGAVAAAIAVGICLFAANVG